MKTRLARISAVSLALLGLAVGPAAAASNSIQLPVTPGPVAAAPGGGATINVAFCEAVAWWPWCRK